MGFLFSLSKYLQVFWKEHELQYLSKLNKSWLIDANTLSLFLQREMEACTWFVLLKTPNRQ